MNVLGIGPLELVAVFVVAFLLLGPRRMMDMSKKLGKTINQIRRTTEDLPSLLEDVEAPPRPPEDSQQRGKER